MRKIIHVDMDYFYAQVEILERPEIKDRPVAVGGLPGTRSVLCTSNYVARKFGVRSAMPTDFALKLCPQLIVIPPHFYKYEKISSLIFEIFYQYSDLVESISLDEAFIDISHLDRPELIAEKIKDEIYLKTGLTASVGLAPNKFLAKIASDYNKPNGIFFIQEKDIHHFVFTLPIKNIPGVGNKTKEILRNLNIETCGDIINVDPNILQSHLGKYAFDLINFCSGIDHRPVESEYERKSLGTETTFLTDIIESDILKIELMNLFDSFSLRLDEYIKENPSVIIHKQFIKIKYSDFKKSQGECTLPISYDQTRQLAFEEFYNLFLNVFNKRPFPVRLIGLGVRFKINKIEKNIYTPQLSFFDIFYKDFN